MDRLIPAGRGKHWIQTYGMKRILIEWKVEAIQAEDGKSKSTLENYILMPVVPLIQFSQNDKIIYRFSGCQRLRMCV